MNDEAVVFTHAEDLKQSFYTTSMALGVEPPLNYLW